MAEIEDTSKDLPLDQFEAKKKEFDALTLRAQFLAGQTPEAEIERQGGEGDLVRVASPEESDVTPPNKKAQLEALGKAVRSAFGGTAGYLRAARDPGRARMTAKQLSVLQMAKQLTRTIVGTANDDSGGEYLLPLQQVESIFRIDNTIQGLLQRARMYSMRGRSLRIPYAIQDEEDLTRPLSGISAVQIIGEGSTKDTREPTFGERILLAFKYAAIAQFSDEMLEDDMTGELDQAVIDLVGQEILNQLNFDITINGGGTTAPTGALHTSANGALLKVTRQTQNRITFTDVKNMYVQHTHGPNSFWLISRRAMGELFTF
jgi:HK97 family phage major capsid protein